MKILFITSHLNTGGITSYLLSLTRGLTKQGHQVIVASHGGDCQKMLEDYGGKHFNLGFRTKSEIDIRIYLNLARVKEFILKEGVDIIHAQTRVTQVMGHFLSQVTHKPMVTTCHGFFKPHFFRRIFPCWGCAVIAISRPVYDHLIRDFKVDPKCVYTISNGIDAERFSCINQQSRDARRKQWQITAPQVIGIIARLSDVKGIDTLIKSMPVVIKEFPQALLMIVGEGPQEKELKSLVEELGLGQNIRFEKIINQTPDILPIFDIFVMPSRQEGLGLSVMEAQVTGLPVIASKVGGLVDLIEDGKTGYFVPPDDPETLGHKIIQVLKTPLEAKAVGLASREYIQKKFSLEQMVEATQKVYEEYSRR